MTYGEMLQAVQQARETISNGDSAARQVARLLVGRLRIAEVDRSALCALKRELRDFDMVTKEWKAPK